LLGAVREPQTFRVNTCLNKNDSKYLAWTSLTKPQKLALQTRMEYQPRTKPKRRITQ